MQVKNILAAAAVAALGLGAVSANAAVATSTFQVQMTITSSCSVASATGINLNSVVAQTSAVNQNASNTISVICSKNTPFYIGLSPSNASTVGAGVMSGTGSNTDKVPYKLYQDAGFTTVWGNTATNLAKGNGMSGTGGGMAPGKAVSFTAYAQAVNADFTPDNYADTVTVNVNY